MSKKVKKEEKSFNAFDVIAESVDSLKKKQLKAILGSVFLLAILSIVFAIINGITNSLMVSCLTVAAVYGVLNVPYTNFLINVADGRGSLEDMFSKDQYSLSNILIGFMFMSLLLFGTILLIIPAFVFATLFILVLPIAANTTSKCFEAFIKAKELSKGFRGRILTLISVFTLVLIGVVGISIGLCYLIFGLIFHYIFWLVIGIAVGVVAYLIFVMPIYTLSISNLYDNIIAEKKEIRQKALISYKETDKKDNNQQDDEINFDNV